ncbi:MAG: hypothetical protein ACI83H_002445 [Glaciecola sp.]|jgi:hypothetical protein
MKNTKTILIALLLGVLNINEVKSQLIISEFMHESNGNDSLNEWIEIYNYSNDTINLKDYYLEDYGSDSITITTTTNYYLFPDSSIILAADKLTFEQNWLGGIPSAKVIDYDYNQFKMDNDFDEILFFGSSVGYKNDGNIGLSTFLDYNYEIDAKVFTWIYCDTCEVRLNRDSLDVIFGPDPIGYSDSIGMIDSLAYVAVNGDFGSPLVGKYKRISPYPISFTQSIIERNDTVFFPIRLIQGNNDTSVFKFTLNSYANNATYGIDYTMNLNPVDTIIFLPGIDSFLVEIIIFNDSINEGVEWVSGALKTLKNGPDSNKFSFGIQYSINDTINSPKVYWANDNYAFREDTGLIKVGLVIENSNSDSTGVIISQDTTSPFFIWDNNLSIMDDIVFSTLSFPDTIWFPPYFNDTIWLYANVINDTVYESSQGYEFTIIRVTSWHNGIILKGHNLDSAFTGLSILENKELKIEVTTDTNIVTESNIQIDYNFHLNQYCLDTTILYYEIDTANSSGSLITDFTISTNFIDSIILLPYTRDTSITIQLVDDTIYEANEYITLKSHFKIGFRNTYNFNYYLYILDNDSPTSVREIKEEELPIKIYPNPAKNNVFVQIENHKNKEVEIIFFDAFGKTIFRAESQAKNIYKNINVSDLSKGVYFMQITHDNLVQTKKIVVS